MTATARDIRLLGYRITIARGALDAVGDLARAAAPAHRYAVISDETVAARYGARVRASLGEGGGTAQIFTMAPGEAQKTRETWARLTDELLAADFGRDACVVALGGGVVGDVAGFVAATFLRGVRCVQVPTSLLAMVDASIGGKTGVDTPAGKNLVGAFHQPAAVVVDPDALTTLPAEHRRAGLAEMVKHGAIADPEHFHAVASAAQAIAGGDADPDEVTDLVARSIEIKAGVVERDEREGGVRKTLNFGHTLGHAVERCSGYAILHGEAVAIGMCLEAEIAERLGVAEAGTAREIREVLVSAGLPTRLPASISASDAVRATHGDKKARRGQVEYALPKRVGAMAAASTGWALPVPDELVLRVLA